MLDSYSLSGAKVLIADKIYEQSSVEVKNGRLERIGARNGNNLNLDSGLILLPALINVHDHLRGNYLPKVGPPEGSYYLKCADWITDLNKSDVVKERANLTEADCYFLSGYKNLFSGVATVNDHYPHEDNNKYIGNLPLRVIENYTLAHEPTSYSLDWGDGIEIEHARARKNNYPFIIHMEEGFDEEYQRGMDILEDLGCLDDHNVMIHCLGFSEKDIKKTKEKDCTVVWCPGSNFFMFNVTCKIRKILRNRINCALGTDSTHTGGINLLEEMRFARQVYTKMYGEVLDGRTIFDMVTINAAKAFKMESELGSIEEGKYADLLLIKPEHSDPYEALINTEIEDVELLIVEGQPTYGARKYQDFFGLDGTEYTDIKIRGREKFVRGDPAGLLRRVREKIGYNKKLEYMPLDE